MTAEALPERLDELVTRVLAPNAGPMTLDGTNTYLVGARGSGDVVVVDPGPELVEHHRAIESATQSLDATVVGVVVTHHHRDHAQAAGWAKGWQVPLWAFAPDMVAKAAHAADVHAELLSDSQQLKLAGVTLEAVHTPGHSSDHLCVRIVDSDVILTGDHVLGRGTTVVVWPDGDMADYMASLERLAVSPGKALYPGHGDVLHDPAKAIAYYLAHRQERERQVLEALQAGDTTPRQIVQRVYADVDANLHAAAARSVHAHLEKLEREGTVGRDGAADDEGTAYRVR